MNSKFLIPAILFKTLLHLAFFINSYGQAPSQKSALQTGFIIKFKEDLPYQQQLSLLNLKPLLPLDEKTNSLLPGVTLVTFSDKNISQQQIELIKKDLESTGEVVFVNELLSAGNHFAAPLGEFYVKLFSKNDYPLLESHARETRTRIMKEYHYMPGVYILWADKNSAGNARKMADYFSATGLFQYASANMLFSLEDCSPNDQLYPRQWAIENTGSAVQFAGTPDADMDVDSAWTITSGSPLIKVAVLDSGVDTNHVDLSGNLLPGFDATDTTANNSKGFPNTNYPEDAHGTACAGIIAAVANNSIGTAGVAYNCKVIPVKMFYYINYNGTNLPISTGQWGLDAINWAWQNANADVMSNSWGIPDSLMATLQVDTVVSNDAIMNAGTNGRGGKGIPLLFSAGNSPDTFCLWPARTPATIAVAATTMCDELKTFSDCSPESFWASNHGTGLDISAPGVKIATADIMGIKGFSSGNYNLVFNGTSAACPNAAGVMALILSANNSLTAQQARQAISSTCEKVGGYNYNINASYGTWSMELGYGRVNAFNALQYALGKEEIHAKPDFDFYVENNIPGKNILHYRLTKPADVSIEIFDVLGRKISHNTEKKQSPGSYQKEFMPASLSPGNYLIRISVNDKTRGGKFLIK